ncbi:MAG: hypothetical protein WC975_03035 [Phycisphaerae bacterium]
MAVQPSGGRTVPLFVLIIFIVLFLAALTGLVLLFVRQETVTQEAKQDKSLFDSYIGMGVSSRLDAYKALGSSSRPPKSAGAALLDERDQLAILLTGNKASTPKEVAEKLDKAIAGLPETSAAAKKLKDIAKSDLIGAIQQAALLMKDQMDETAGAQQQLADCQKGRDTITSGYKELENIFDNKTKQFMAQMDAQQKSFDDLKNEYTEQLATIKTQVSKELQDKLTQMGKTFNEHVDELRDMVRRNLQVLIKATTESGGPTEVRSAAMMTVEQLTQKIDGEILDIAGPVIYINLGRQQQINPGIRFCVVSESQKGQIRPKLKAVLEVIKVGEMTAEARVVEYQQANPVIKGDLLINLVYDRDMSLNFSVFGDFDLYHVGTIDPTAFLKISGIITTAGGKVAKQLSPTVNFVIMGQPPAEGTAPAATTAPSETTSKPAQGLRTYNDLKDQTQAMGIPVMPPDLFLKYTGFAQKLDD